MENFHYLLVSKSCIHYLFQVLVTMGGKGSCHIHGLSCHHVTSEKEAAGLYELGISNRKIVDSDASCEQRSSRSHLIFTIALSRQKDGAEILFRFVCFCFVKLTLFCLHFLLQAAYSHSEKAALAKLFRS